MKPSWVFRVKLVKWPRLRQWCVNRIVQWWEWMPLSLKAWAFLNDGEGGNQ